MGTKIIIKDADFSANGLITNYTKSDFTTYIKDNNRIRLYALIPSGFELHALKSSGAGSCANVYDTIEKAQIGDVDWIQSFTGSEYTTGPIIGLTTVSGYLTVSLKREDSGQFENEEEINALINSLDLYVIK